MADAYGHLGGRDEAHRICHYFSYLQDELRLTDWRVLLAAKAAPKDTMACLHICDPITTVLLHVQDGWADLSPSEKRRVLTHEALHLVTWRTDRWLPTKKMVGKQAAEMAESDSERVVDHLTNVVAPLLHPWGSAKIGDRTAWTALDG